MSELTDPEILVAFKKSRWEHHLDGDGRSAGSAATGESLDRLEEAHRIHRSGLERVVDHVTEAGFEPTVAYRGDIDRTDPYDLIVTVGGDGTVLDLSHKVEDVPILAVNSHPSSSVGYFCAGTAASFPELFESTLSRAITSYDLLRFRIRIDGEPTGPPILNDFLFSHENPAAVSQYVLETETGEPESQRSSGVWVCTPAGSTAAVRSAGGSVLPLGCNSIEFVVREAYTKPGEPYRHDKGIQPATSPLRIESRMQDGCVFVDGPHIRRRLDFGQTIAVDSGAPDLRMLGLHIERRDGG